MSAIKKTYEQVNEINLSASEYLKKSGVVDDYGREIPEAKKSKLDLALLEILKKQVGKKILVEKAKKIERLEIKHAMVDPNTKKLMVAERANPRMGIPKDIYDYTPEGKEALLDAIDALEKESVDLHTRSIPEADMPTLTEEEQEAFGDLIVIEKAKE